MIRHLFISLGLVLVALATAAADRDIQYVTEGGRLMCTSDQSYREAQDLISKRDASGLQSLRECIRSKPGLKAEIVTGGVLTARIKVYDDAGKWTMYWTSPTTVKEVRR